MAVEPLAEEQVASWKTLGVEICIHSKAIGDVWIVAAYTPQASKRKELSIDDFLKIRRVWEAFPGAAISEFKSLIDIPAGPPPPPTW